jgi:hypothetical protein
MTFDTTPATLGAAMEAACLARDAALADPIGELHGIRNEWIAWTSRIADAPNLERQIELARAAETAMRRRTQDCGVVFRRMSGAPIDFTSREDDVRARRRTPYTDFAAVLS